MKSNWFKLFLKFKYLLLLFLGIQLGAKAQSYYFFDFDAKIADSSQVKYVGFLTLGIDGTAIARFKYKSLVNGEEHLVEQRFTDTSSINIQLNNAKRYLTTVEDPDYLQGSIDPNFPKFRISFTKKSDSNGVYYEPEGFDFLTSKNEWQTGIVNENQNKSLSELRNDKTILRFFYGENEPFYTYIDQLNSRGLDQADLKSTFYLIAVVNTLDQSIGVTTQKDLKKIKETFSVLSSQLGIKYVEKIISGNDLNKKNVENAIKLLKVKDKDIIFFYYSGHGFRYDNDKSAFPRMSLRLKKEISLKENNLELEQVNNQLIGKKARVTIVLSDCCNENIGLPPSTGISTIRPRAVGNTKEKLNIDNCKKLLFPSNRISLIIGAAEKNQLSSGNPELGGFYTNFFQSELIKNLYSNQENPTWINISITAKNNTTRQALTALCGSNRCVQRAEVKFTLPR